MRVVNTPVFDLSWLSLPTAGATTVAFTELGIKTRIDVCRDVAALLPALQAHPAREWFWWETDSYRFLIGALAVMVAGKTLVLPPNTTPATVQMLLDAGAVALNDIEIVAGDPRGVSALPLPPQAPIVLFTSGSSGAPKRIERQLGQLLLEVRTLEQVFGAHLKDHSVIATVSHQHIYGLLFKLLWPLTTGRAFMSHQCEHPEQLVQALTLHKNAVVVSSPALLARWPDTLPLPASCVFSSGGPLPADARRQLAPLCAGTLTEVLGSSETGGIAWRSQDAAGWQPLPDVAFRVIANDALEVRTPHAWHPGWMATGDTAQPTDDGRFVLGPRLDRLLKLEQKRISLDAVEMALRALPEVRDAHVLPLWRETRQEIAAVIVPSADGREQHDALGKAAFSRQLRATLRARIEPLALPRRWRFLESLPMNSQGKLDQVAMAALFVTAPVGTPTLPEVLRVQASGDALLVEARVPPALHYLEGHFPASPVVPGVAQIAWVEQFARAHLGLQGHFCKMEQLKFTQLLRPLAEFSLHIEYQRDKSRLVFRLANAEYTYSSGRLVYRKETS